MLLVHPNLTLATAKCTSVKQSATAERVQRQEWRVRRVRLQVGSVHEHFGPKKEWRRSTSERQLLELNDMNEDRVGSLKSICWNVLALNAAQDTSLITSTAGVVGTLVRRALQAEPGTGLRA